MRRLTHTDEQFNGLFYLASANRFCVLPLLISLPFGFVSLALAVFLSFSVSPYFVALFSLYFSFSIAVSFSLSLSPLWVSSSVRSLIFSFFLQVTLSQNSLSYSLLSLSKYLVLSFISVSSAYGALVLSPSLSSVLFLTVEYICDNQEFLFTL